MKRFVDNCLRKTLFLVALLLPISALSDSKNLTLTTEEYPPFNMTERSGEVTGISTEIVQELMKRSGQDYQIQLLPWNRAYSMALENTDTGVFSTTLTQDRKELFKWVSPVAYNNWVLMAKKGASIQLNSLEDAKKYRIGAYRGDAIAVFLEKEGFDLDLVRRDELNPLKLDRGRIDLWATGHLLGPYLAKEQNVEGLEDVLTFRKTTMGLAFHKDTPDTLIEKLNSILNDLYLDGTVEDIYAKYR